MPLSYNWTAMTTLVNSMSPNGNTNQGIGLAHGWMSLVGGGPYPTPPAMDPNYKYQQVIILLTDGLNTQNRWYTNQTPIDDSRADDLRQHQCRRHHALHGAGQYRRRSDFDAAEELRWQPGKYPDSSKFFLLTSANAIVTTFDQIATQLSNLRVAK